MPPVKNDSYTSLPTILPFTSHGVGRNEAFDGKYEPINIYGRYNYTPNGSTTPTAVNLFKAPVADNLFNWNVPRAYSYADIYNAAAGNKNAYDNYMTYLKSQPQEALSRVATNISFMGNGPKFMRYPILPPAKLNTNLKHVPDFTDIWTNSNGAHFSTAAPLSRFHDKINISKLFGAKQIPRFSYITGGFQQNRLMDNIFNWPYYYEPKQTMNKFKWKASSGGPMVIGHYLSPITRFHEATHAAQITGMHDNAMGLKDADNMWNPYYEHGAAEQAQAARAINVALEALQNRIKEGTIDISPEDKVLAMKYPAHGTRDQFIARNNEFIQHPEFVQKYLGVEAARPLAGIDANQRALARGKSLGDWNYMNAAYKTAIQQAQPHSMASNYIKRFFGKILPGKLGAHFKNSARSPAYYERLERYMNNARALSPEGQKQIRNSIDRMNDYYLM